MELSVLIWVRPFCRPPFACFRGDPCLAGDDGTVGASLIGGLNTCDGSTLSLILLRRGFAAGCGVSLTLAVVLRLIEVLLVVVVDFLGAGVNSSLTSSLLKLASSTSEESMTA